MDMETRAMAADMERDAMLRHVAVRTRIEQELKDLGVASSRRWPWPAGWRRRPVRAAAPPEVGPLSTAE